MVRTKLYDKLKELFETDSDEDFVAGKYLSFESHNQLFGVPIIQVEQIISMQDIVSVPEFPEYVRGVIKIRGKIIPVVDLNLRFGKGSQLEKNATIIIINVSDSEIGLIVDDVNDIISVKESEIYNPPQLSSDPSISYLKGFAKHNDDVVLIMDTDKILNEQEFKLITGERLKKILSEMKK